MWQNSCDSAHISEHMYPHHRPRMQDGSKNVAVSNTISILTKRKATTFLVLQSWPPMPPRKPRPGRRKRSPRLPRLRNRRLKWHRSPSFRKATAFTRLRHQQDETCQSNIDECLLVALVILVLNLISILCQTLTGSRVARNLSRSFPRTHYPFPLPALPSMRMAAPVQA
jgi:hypothetical protein